ncbi:Synaptojanin-2 [Binucleata daphniae]
MNLAIITYNIHNTRKILNNIESIFDNIPESTNIIFITLQEVYNPYGRYQDLINVCQHRYPNHNIIYERLWGLLSLVITKFQVEDKLKIGLGYFGLPNKGFIAIQIYDILLIGCHLCAGDNNMANRMESIDYIFKTTGKYFKNVNTTVFAGDMNFRMKNDKKLKNEIQNMEHGDTEKISELLKKSDDKQFIKKYRKFVEKEIKFLPTYKFKDNKYDDKRMPSWCDRIYIKSDNEFEIKEYKSLDILISDHKPVFAIAEVQFYRTCYRNKANQNYSFLLFIKICLVNFCCFVHENLLLVTFTIVVVGSLVMYKKLNTQK